MSPIISEIFDKVCSALPTLKVIFTSTIAVKRKKKKKYESNIISKTAFMPNFIGISDVPLLAFWIASTETCPLVRLNQRTLKIRFIDRWTNGQRFKRSNRSTSRPISLINWSSIFNTVHRKELTVLVLFSSYKLDERRSKGSQAEGMLADNIQRYSRRRGAVDLVPVYF